MPQPALDTLETRLVRIEGMLEEITERIIASNTEQRAIRDLIEEMKERQ